MVKKKFITLLHTDDKQTFGGICMVMMLSTSCILCRCHDKVLVLNTYLIYKKRMIQQPSYQEIFLQALQAHKNHELHLAEEMYRQLLRINPDDVGSLVNLGVILKGKGLLPAAHACYARAYALQPNAPAAISNLANTYMLQGKFQEALEWQEKLLQTKQHTAEVYYNRGLIFRCLGRLSEAVFSFDRALSIRPDFMEASWDRALTLLAGGDIQSGFNAFESRWQFPHMQKPVYKHQEWNGSDPADKTILLYTEQSAVDVMFFIRFAEMLHKKGARIILQCQADLAGLLRHTPFIDQVIPYGESAEHYDYHLSLLSLPHKLGVTSAMLPQTIPYISLPTLQPLPFLNADSHTVRIGLVWSAKDQAMGWDTSGPGLKPFIQLLQSPNSYFYSLQMGDAARDVQNMGVHGLIRDLSPHISSLEDIARILDQLDLLITVDGTIAHMAGAMGVPTWVVLPLSAGWHWGIHPEISTWYPTAKIFRQVLAHDWQPPFTKMSEKLKNLVDIRESQLAG